MKYLSSNFTLEEFTISQEAARSDLTNDPPPDILEQLYRTAYALEEVRMELHDKPVLISSGYRCLDLSRILGSEDTSQHILGQAVDFICPEFGSPREIVERLMVSALSFDILALERGRWVHISFSDRNRREVFTIDSMGKRPFV